MAANLLVFSALLIGSCRALLPPFFYSPYEYGRYETLSVMRGEYPGYLQKSYDLAQLRPWVERHGGPILCENQGNVGVMGETPWLCDISYFSVIANSGGWDQEPLLALIRERHFSLIVLQRLDSPRFTQEIIATIAEHYIPVAQVGSEYILRPR